MKRLVLVAFLLPITAHAQTPPDPNAQALSQEIMQCVGDKVSLRTQIIAAQTHEVAAIAAAKEAQKKEDEAPHSVPVAPAAPK
jgi:hypothetical protein